MRPGVTKDLLRNTWVWNPTVLIILSHSKRQLQANFIKNETNKTL